MTDETLLCITHYIAGVAPCMQRNAHFAACSSGTCTGCVPRTAQHGYMCGACWYRLEQAISEWDYQFFPTFAHEVRAIQPEPAVSGKPSSRLPLSPLQLAMDEILRFQKGRTAAHLWVSTPEGAEAAVRFTRAVEHAVRAFPRTEGMKKIPTTRCPACRQRTLVYDPAHTFGADATVKCLNLACGNVMDHTAFERIALIEAQCCRRCRDHDGCTNPTCTCHRFAPVPEWERTTKGDFEPFDPTNPEHVDLLEAS